MLCVKYQYTYIWPILEVYINNVLVLKIIVIVIFKMFSGSNYRLCEDEGYASKQDKNISKNVTFT